MKKIFQIATREFLNTVITKGFVFGILMTPVLIAVAVLAMGLLRNIKPPKLSGSVAIIDQSGSVAQGFEKRFSAEALGEENAKKLDDAQKALKQATSGAGALPMPGTPGMSGMADAGKLAAAIAGPSADLTVEILPADTDPSAAKKPLEDAKITRAVDANKPGDAAPSRLALVVVPRGAVVPGKANAFDPYQSFFTKELDGEVQENIQRRLEKSIIDARLATDAKLLAGGITPKDILTLTQTPKGDAKTVSKQGEKKSLGPLAMLVPMAFMMLLFVAVMTSGQYLLTSTVEEKSNRVMEILLSAVSPVQLMTGKILGYMGVGLVVLLVYTGLGIAGLIAAARMDAVKPSLLVYMMIYFMIAYALIAALLAAIGAAVNEMREAQTLQTPIMLLMSFPMMIWFIIQRAPNSTLATVLSFIPVLNPFVMMLRLSGSEPIPTWQIPASIALGIVSVVVAIWLSAKVFRIGSLMYGKPPDFKTLIRWIRQA